MEDFKEVSLGFAEFVSQLIQETFDAVLSSQNYQLEKYAELEAKMNLPNNLFAEYYITSDQIETKKLEHFGFKIEPQMHVDEDLRQFIAETFDLDQGLIYNNKLTGLGSDLINGFISDLLVRERKSILNALLNKSGVSNLVVDSGEISAKLELKNLFSGENAYPVSPSLQKIEQDVLTKEKVKLPTIAKEVDVINIKDALTGHSTVLIDKKTANDIGSSNYQIPNVRLSAQPAKLNSSSNLYSEIKINFKTV